MHAAIRKFRASPAAHSRAATTPADRAAAQLAHAYWVNFAKTGVPSATGGGHWSPYAGASDAVMIFDAAGAHQEPDPIRARLDFVEATMAAKAP